MIAACPLSWRTTDANVTLYRPLDKLSRCLYTRDMAKTPLLKQQTYRVDRSHYSDNLDKLHDLALSVRLCEQQMPALVETARAEGATWADIGRELGVTRSAAQQRFG